MMKKLVQLTIGVLTFLAFTNAASACWFSIYQPELPKQLRDK